MAFHYDPHEKWRARNLAIPAILLFLRQTMPDNIIKSGIYGCKLKHWESAIPLLFACYSADANSWNSKPDCKNSSRIASDSKTSKRAEAIDIAESSGSLTAKNSRIARIAAPRNDISERAAVLEYGSGFNRWQAEALAELWDDFERIQGALDNPAPPGPTGGPTGAQRGV